MELKKLIVDLSSLMSIGGFERFERDFGINILPGKFLFIVFDVSGITMVVFKLSRFSLLLWIIITGRRYPGSLPNGIPKSNM